jgi:Xaa-Pro dipeptidase
MAKGIILNKSKLEKHILAGKLLEQAKNACFDYLKKNPTTSEFETAEFMREVFSALKLKPGKGCPIVAFRENTSFVHYYPKKKNAKRLKKNTLILLDMWAQAGRGQIFSDITWMAYFGGKIPLKMQKVAKLGFSARDKAIAYIERELKKGNFPIAKEIDLLVRRMIFKSGYGQMPHSLGHCIGTVSVHGRGDHIAPRFDRPILTNVAYTIEPGIYLKNKFGFRTEIDFYIDSKKKLHITTPVQKKIEFI